MATIRTKKLLEPANEKELEVVASNLEEEKPETETGGGDTVTIACHLAHGLKVDDVDNGKGGVKTVIFPGVNAVLRGKNFGILVGRGKAVAVTIPRRDWEDILRKHGRERAFTGHNGNPPCLIEMKNKDEFKARQDEVAEMVHGLEPQDPKQLKVEETVRVE